MFHANFYIRSKTKQEILINWLKLSFSITVSVLTATLINLNNSLMIIIWKNPVKQHNRFSSRTGHVRRTVLIHHFLVMFLIIDTQNLYITYRHSLSNMSMTNLISFGGRVWHWPSLNTVLAGFEMTHMMSACGMAERSSFSGQLIMQSSVLLPSTGCIKLMAYSLWNNSSSTIAIHHTSPQTAATLRLLRLLLSL